MQTYYYSGIFSNWTFWSNAVTCGTWNYCMINYGLFQNLPIVFIQYIVYILPKRVVSSNWIVKKNYKYQYLRKIPPPPPLAVNFHSSSSSRRTAFAHKGGLSLPRTILYPTPIPPASPDNGPFLTSPVTGHFLPWRLCCVDHMARGSVLQF